MIKHVCPICDKVMPSKHICPNCKSWVKKPYTTDVNYYLNETHPQDELDCSYHNQHSLNRVMNTTQKAMNESQSVMKQTSAHLNPRQEPISSMSGGQKLSEGKKPKSLFSGIKFLILFIVVINVIIPMIIRMLRGLSYYIRYSF